MDIEALRINIKKEVTEDIPAIRKCFIEQFNTEIEKFCEYILSAYLYWQKVESIIQEDKRKAYVGAVVFTAINLHIVSFKLFLSGYPIASGNLQRQVIESIALAILFSEKSLDILDNFMNNMYSTNKALRDLRRHRIKLNLKEDGLEALEKGLAFYHKYSHPSPMTIAEQINFQNQGLFLGACFDEGKLVEYGKDINGRVSLSGTLSNMIQGVLEKLSKW